MKIKDGVLISVDPTDVINGVWIIPDEVTDINDCVNPPTGAEVVIAPNVVRVGSNAFSYTSSLAIVEFPKLKSIGDGSFSGNRCFISGYFPKLKSIGDSAFRDNPALLGGNFPKLETVGMASFSYNVSFFGGNFPELTNVGSWSFWANQSFSIGNFPKLKDFGEYSFMYNTPIFNLKTKHHEVVIRLIDGISHIEGTTRKIGDVEIMSGYWVTGSNFRDTPFIIVRKGATTAHGETVTQAIADLRYKIATAKLRSTPISKDTVITVEYYRQLTGACQFGIKQWMDSHHIPYRVEGTLSTGIRVVEETEITAGELLPLLEKSNAYGLDKFRELLID